MSACIDARATSTRRAPGLSPALVLCGACLGLAGAMAPPRDIAGYGIQSWTGRAGLPGEAVYGVMQTPDGYLWARTNGGICRFDGVRFSPLEMRVGRSPIREIPRSMCPGVDGRPLIRTATRTLSARAAGLAEVAEPGPPTNGVAQSVFQARDGRIWVGGDCSLGVVERGRLEELDPATGPVRCFLEEPRGDLWVGTSLGLYRYREGRRVGGPADFAPIDDVNALTADGDGGLLVGTSWGLFRVGRGRAPEQVEVGGATGRSVGAVMRDRAGTLWVGIDSMGLYRRVGGRWDRLSTADGLASDIVLSLFEDREGSLWVGTDGGLTQLRANKVRTISRREGMPHADTYGVLAAEDGGVYVTTRDGLARLGEEGPPRVYRERDGLPNNYTLGLMQGRDGSIWFGTAAGLCQLKDGRVTSYSGVGAMGTSCVMIVSEDDQGILIFTAEGPPLRLRGRLGSAHAPTIAPAVLPEALRGAFFFTAHRGGDGTRWYGTTSGLFRERGGSLEDARRVPGIDFAVASVWDDGRGSLWVVGRAPGVTRLSLADGSTTRYTAADGLFEDELTAAICDADGDLWASTPRGIFRVRRRDLDAFAEGRLAAIRSAPFGVADGMRTTECGTQERQPAAWAGRDGRLWFTTRNGVVEVDPRRIVDNNTPTPVVVERLIVDHLALPSAAEVHLPVGASRVEFHYAGLSLRTPERVRFRTMLEGFDAGWVEAETRRSAHYTDLPPGRYRFRVRACNDDGLWGRVEAAVDLVLPPRLDQRAEFRVGVVAAAALLAFSLYRQRVTTIRRREGELSRLVGERTVELEQAKVELELRNRRLAELATTDPLTGLCNRRRFLEALAAALRAAQRHRGPTSILILDVDHFKAYNDAHGHPAGDEALRVVAGVLRGCRRPEDVPARLGGEEFVVLLPATDATDAAVVAERLRAEIESAPWTLRRVTASVGVATGGDAGVADLDALIAAADRALYRAKREGRNRVERADPADHDHDPADASSQSGLVAGIALN